MLFKRSYYLSLIFALFSFHLQAALITGTVQDEHTGQGLANVRIAVEGTDVSSFSGANGEFSLNYKPSDGSSSATLLLSVDGYQSVEKTIGVEANNDLTLGVISMRANSGAISLDSEDLIPTITIELDDAGDGGQEDISGLLTASRDPFISAASFTFGTRRFRVKGYDSENTLTYLNGVVANDPENGRVIWGYWGGLNDVTRNKETQIGLAAMDFSFGGIGGATHIDTRASNIRKTRQISVSGTNTSYRNRVMGTWATGMMPNGWAVAISGSHRWAQEAYVEGTTYDAWSYFLSVDRKINDKQMLNLTVLGAPNKRGRGGASVMEMYDIADDKYYNPYWGYQNGEKRNSRVSKYHQPIVGLRHDLSIGDNGTLTTAANYQFGRNGGTALDWYNARDPRPDYYRYLPSWIPDEGQRDEADALMRADKTLRQIDWDYLYEVNRNSVYDGDEAPELAGMLRAQYLVEDRRYDSKRANFNTTYNHTLNDVVTLTSGVNYLWYKGNFFREVVDLLGADFTLDIDKFAERDLPDNSDALQNDLNNPNRVVREGDKWGYEYDPNIRKVGWWGQGQFELKKIDAFVSAELTNTDMWREGKMRNGKFPDSSFGDSEKLNFFNYGVKGGLTYKIDGRNYVHARGSFRTRAPFIRDAFVSPRTRNQVTPGLTSEEILGGEIGFSHRSPGFKAQANFFYTEFKNQNYIRGVYFDVERTFGNVIMTGIDQQHMGAELAIEAKLTSSLTVNAVAGLGQYIYNSRPDLIITQDNNSEFLVSEKVYLKNFYVAGTPQSAYTVGLSYWGKNFLSFWVNLSYFDNIYIDTNPLRRTSLGVAPVEQGSELYDKIITQEKVDGGLMLDVSARKSWRFNDYFLIANLGFTNLLNNQNLITGGFEQLRFDFAEKDVDRFPSKYYYGYGMTFFANVTFRF